MAWGNSIKIVGVEIHHNDSDGAELRISVHTKFNGEHREYMKCVDDNTGYRLLKQPLSKTFLYSWLITTFWGFLSAIVDDLTDRDGGKANCRSGVRDF